VVDGQTLGDAELVMLQALQGILSQDRSEENIWLAFPNGYEIWLEDLSKNYGVALDYTYKDRPWGLVDYFRSHLNGYVLYNPGEDSENVATTLAGIYKVLPVTPELANEAEKRGLGEVFDVRGKDESWCLKVYAQLTSRRAACLQREDVHDSLRDYAVSVRALTFYDADISFIRKAFEGLDEGGMVLGWGGPEEFGSEREFVAPASEEGLLTIATDRAHNLSVLSGFKPESIRQKRRAATVEGEKNVHYVTFIMGDGDNVQWLLNDFATDERWFGSPLRGEFPMGWTISPSMLDLCPTVMRWLYNRATSKDFFLPTQHHRRVLGLL